MTHRFGRIVKSVRASARACLSAGVASLFLAAPAAAEKRVALVIGNSAYVHAPALANPRNDAEGVAAALKRLGFDVSLGIDLDKAAADRLLEAFEKKLDGADVALFFYAGHGLQVNGRNFLVPIDAKLEREAQLNFQAVALDLVQTLMEQTPRTNVIILDACRDNPLARTLARSMGTRSNAIGNGLAQVQGGRGTLIVYATQPGNVALDGQGKNSPFTAALLEHIETPGLEVRQVLTRVRASVTKATGDKQLPWEATSLIGDFYFAPKAAAETKPGETKPPVSVTPPVPPGVSSEFETLFWQSIKDSKNAADYKAYLQRWPNGVFVPLARIRIADLEAASSEESKREEERRRKVAEDQRADAERKGREEARREAERKQQRADGLARSAGQRLDQARAALRQGDYLAARRLAGESAALLVEANGVISGSAAAAKVFRDLEAFRGDLEKRVDARAAVLVREARGFIAAKKFAEAEKRLVEAERLASASTVAARRELEAAQGRAEEEVRRKAEDEAKKKSDEAKPATPDPAKQAQIALSWYAPERKRGAVAFAHKKSELEPAAIAALERLAASVQAQKDYKIVLGATADRLEGTPGEQRALSRARIDAVARWLTGKGIAPASVQGAVRGAAGEGPAGRVVTVAVEIAAPARTEDAPSAPAPNISAQLVGTEWRGTLAGDSVPTPFPGQFALLAIIRFKAGGQIDLAVQTLRGGPGAQAHMRDHSEPGTWSATERRVCVKWVMATANQQQCYSATANADGSVTLSGAGFLAGKRFFK